MPIDIALRAATPMIIYTPGYAMLMMLLILLLIRLRHARHA